MVVVTIMTVTERILLIAVIVRQIHGILLGGHHLACDNGLVQVEVQIPLPRETTEALVDVRVGYHAHEELAEYVFHFAC